MLSYLITYFTAAFSHRILSFVSPSVATSTSPMYVKLKRSAFGAANKDKAWNVTHENEACVTSANLSSTLEKLYVWERKLYKEVKVISICCSIGLLECCLLAERMFSMTLMLHASHKFNRIVTAK